MKKVSLSMVLVVIFTTMAFAGKDKSTLKEKVEKSKTVKVFFNVSEIIDQDHENKLKQSNPKSKTDIRTKMPEAFYSSAIKNSVIKNLNEGLEVGSAFVEGDIAELPMSDKKNTNYRDLSKLADGIYALVDITGRYERFVSMSDGVVSNSMKIEANLFFYEVTGGKVNKIKVNMGMGAFLGRASTATIKTPSLEGLVYLETNFPASPLLAEYTRTMEVNTKDVAARLLKKHNKTISKRK